MCKTTEKEQVKVLGYTDSVSECGLCGRIELKGTYAVEYGGGEIVYLGSTCVKNRFGLASKDVKNELKTIEERVRKGLNIAEENATKALREKMNEIDDFMDPLFNELLDKELQIKKIIKKQFATNYPYLFTKQMRRIIFLEN